MTRYPNLFSPIRVGPTELRNRIIQTGHSKHFSHRGIDSARDLHYLEARARGGAALLITGNRLVHPTSSVAAAGFPRGYLAEAVESDRRLTAAVHRHSSAIVAQLSHQGVNGSSDAADDLRVLWAPSEVRSPYFGETPKPMDDDDLAELPRWWALAAVNCREGGFDGVEVHCAHTYLLNQFLSPLYNRRTDRYGGSLENRARLPREVIEAVRAAAGDDFIVGIRLSLGDAVAGGLELADCLRIADILTAGGIVDYVGVSIGGYHDGLGLAIAVGDAGDGWLVEATATLKERLPDTPVYVVGGIRTASDAEAALATGSADLVGLTRAQIADPDFANKVRDGRDDEVTHCIRANQGCVSRTWRGLSMGCTVNPAVGREELLGRPLPPAPAPRSWVVVGGGPAGMKAAATLAARGHRVTLLERDDELGGQVRLIAAAPGRNGFGLLVRDLERQLARLAVDVRTGVEAAAEDVLRLRPDEVIVATGAVPDRSGSSSVAPMVAELPGLERIPVSTAWDVHAGHVPAGRRVVLLDDDGTRCAAGAAELLLDAGRSVDLVSRWGSLFPSTSVTLDTAVVCRRLLGKGMTFRLNTWARRIDRSMVVVFNVFTGVEEPIGDVDAVVLATGSHADLGPYHQLATRHSRVHRIGDCLAPRRVDHAVYEGFMAGLERWAPAERFIYENALTQ